MNSLKITLIAIVSFSFQSLFAQATKIDIKSPQTQTNYQKGDTIFISAEVSSDAALHDVNVLISSENDSNMVYFNKNYHTHGSRQTIQLMYILPLADKTNLRLMISTYNHGNVQTAKKQMVVRCNYPNDKVKTNSTPKPKKSKSKKEKKPKKAKGKK
jgi:hypothetical protein